MENKKQVSMLLDEDILESFDVFCKDIGLSRAAAITLFMKNCIANRRLPFTPGEKKSTDGFKYSFEPDLEERLRLLVRESMIEYGKDK